MMHFALPHFCSSPTASSPTCPSPSPSLPSPSSPSSPSSPPPGPWYSVVHTRQEHTEEMVAVSPRHSHRPAPPGPAQYTLMLVC
jgi:hypothetical protein